MTLEELKQIKDSLSQGVMIHKGKWIEVLDTAIELAENEYWAGVADDSYSACNSED